MKTSILVTGGAGFIDTNLVYKLKAKDSKIIILDNLSRKGTDINLKWLKKNLPSNSFKFIKGDIRDFSLVKKITSKVDVVYHLAAQVAVTTSFKNPREDFEVNALGSFNILEAARLSASKPILLFASTNKVYSALYDLRVKEKKSRYVLADFPYGINE